MQSLAAMQSTSLNRGLPGGSHRADRAHSETFKMSQKYLAEMLGASRRQFQTTAGFLKDAKLIEYNRGTIHILDVPGLERKACECYHIIKDHLDNYAEFDSGITLRLGLLQCLHSSRIRADCPTAFLTRLSPRIPSGGHVLRGQ